MKNDPVTIDNDKVLIDCYRFKIEITKEGYLKIYAFNPRARGDVLVLIKPDKIELTWEDGRTKEILKERLATVVFNKLFEDDDY